MNRTGLFIAALAVLTVFLGGRDVVAQSPFKFKHHFADPGLDGPNLGQTDLADLNGNGRIDFVAGGAWYENPGNPTDREFIRHVFDAELDSVHDIIIGDIDGDGRADVVTMADRRRFPGKRPPRWFIWENVDGKGTFKEHVILDAKLGGHETVVGDVDGDGDIAICSKPWTPAAENGNGGTGHISYLENLTSQAGRTPPSDE